MGGVSNAAGLGSVQPSQQPQYNQQQGFGGVMQGVGGLANGVTNTIGGLAQQAYNQAMGNMPQQSQGFGPNVDNFAPQNTGQIGQIPQQGLGIASGVLQGLSQSPAMQTLGQAATGQQTPLSQQQWGATAGQYANQQDFNNAYQNYLNNFGQQPSINQTQPVPEWIRLAQQSGNMQNPYASQAPQTLNQASLRPLQAPDTSQDAYNRYMAQVSFASGAAMPTYDQFVQQRNQGFQQAQQFQQMSPEQQAAQMQAGNNQKMASLGMPTRPPYPATSPFSPQNVNYQPKSLADVQQMMGNQPAPSQTLPQSTAQQPMSPQTQPRRSFNWADRFNRLSSGTNQQNLANLLRRR